MPDNVIKFYPKNAAKDPDVVLELAAGVYDEVLVIGWDKDGMLDVRANLSMSHEKALWLINRFQTKLINGEYSPVELD